MVAPRLPFLQIRLKGAEQQWALHGNVVNVESNINTCVTALPRPIKETSVVQIQLMRRMCYTGPYITEKINPMKVIKATRELLATPLYQKYEIILSENWDYTGEESVDFDVDDEESPIQNDANNIDENIQGNHVENKFKISVRLFNQRSYPFRK